MVLLERLEYRELQGLREYKARTARIRQVHTLQD
jgi:hypothetical protein